VPAGLARKQRWEDVRYEIREAGLRFLQCEGLATATTPLRILLHATAGWLRKMLVNAYRAPMRVTTRRRAVRDKTDMEAFTIFKQSTIEDFVSTLKLWGRSWASKWPNARNVYSRSLTVKQRELETDASSREGESFADSGGVGMVGDAKIHDFKATSSDRRWGNYKKTALPRTLNCSPKTFNKCLNCKKPSCWPCRIAQLQATISDACKHAKKCGSPFVSSLSRCVYGYQLPLKLPGYVQSEVV
jgi:hypothetical protein